jgi:Family of unknown function (DUF6186)
MTFPAGGTTYPAKRGRRALAGARPATRYVMRPRTGRLLILAGWLWLGWHYFAR